MREEGEIEEKEGKERTAWGEGGAVCLLFTGHPRHWAPTDSYDSRPARTRRLFCGSLVAFVPRRVVPVQLPRRPFPPHIGRDPSSAFFFHRVSFTIFSPRLLPSSFSVSGLDANVVLVSCPCFHRVRVLVFSFRFSFPLSFRFTPLYLFLPPSCPALPCPALPLSSSMLPASLYTSPGSRLLLVSFSPYRAGLFAGAEASPGLAWEWGEW